MLKELPDCRCCGTQMEDSGMTEDAEFLTAIPRQYFVVRQKRHKYRCGKCHGDIQTAPAPPRIKEGSSYTELTPNKARKQQQFYSPWLNQQNWISSTLGSTLENWCRLFTRDDPHLHRRNTAKWSRLTGKVDNVPFILLLKQEGFCFDWLKTSVEWIKANSNFFLTIQFKDTMMNNGR